MGLERPAPPPTLCAQADTPLGTPQDLQDLLPLTTPDAADAGEDADGFDVVHARTAEIAG